jgi:RNA polymerase sigma factor (sigma-70 family)
MENAEVIKRIKEGDKSILEHVYIKYRTDFIEWLASVYNLNTYDAKELYQQTIMAFYENIVNGKLNEMKSNIRTYLFSIGKNKFAELNRHWNRNTPDINVNIPDDGLSPGETEQDDELVKLSEKALMQMGNPCKELLILYYYHKKSMTEIAEILGYQNGHTARNKKYRCLGQLKEIIEEQMQKN